jgi:polysaccharide export outer membrane protein
MTSTLSSRFRKLLTLSCSALVLASSMDAQIDQYKLFQQQQSKAQDQTDVRGMLDGTSEDHPSETNQSFPKRRLPSLKPALGSDSDFDDAGNVEFEKTRPRSGSKYEREREPENPTEFQQFVQSSIGQMLSIYGSWLFDRVPSTYAPVEHIPVTPDYTVGPGDEIDIRVWGQINFGERLLVSRTGDIFIPHVGRISLSGLRFAELQETIKSSIGRVYKNFDLNVNMGQLRSIQVLIVGYARQPGTYTLSSLSTVVNAIFASGGPSVRGSMRNIQVKRHGKVVMAIDLYDLLLHGDQSDDCPLQPGDVIFIPAAGPRVAIAGSIENPAIYEIKPGASLQEALDYAGGLSPVAAGQHAVLQRIDKRAALQSQDLDLSASGPSTALQNGDIVRLLPVVPRFDKTVTLRGNVADPARFPWHVNMKISDLIPNKECLLTRDYWHEHNRLADSSTRVNDASLMLVKEVSGTKRKDYHDEKLDASDDSSLAAAQSVQQTREIRHFEPQNSIQPPAPDINWNYAVIERLDTQSLATRLIPFHLGKVVLQHDLTADLPLEPGDIVNVFSLADISTPREQQTKYVHIEGEVKMAGIYSVQPGETLRDLVERAGGLTPNAYLYGSQFTREETRREQQKRYSEFLDQLERDVNQSAATLSTRVVSAQQAATSEASLSGQRAMIQKLRQAPATGRIVLDLKPESNAVEALPHLSLEDGDRLYIPSTPDSVNVVGTIYNQSAFIYAPDRRLSDYLQDAGGPTRYADKSHMFVIRADGSVISKDARSHLLGNDFASLRMYPGDTLVVPTNTTKSTFIRGLMDWSQVISSFGIGAAAINVLK